MSVKYLTILFLTLPCIFSEPPQLRPRYHIPRLQCKRLNIVTTMSHITASHRKSYFPLVLALAKRGHNVTTWNIGFKKPSSATKLITDMSYQIEAENKQDANILKRVFWQFSTTVPSLMMWIPTRTDLKLCRQAMEKHGGEIDRFFEENHYDLMFFSVLFAGCKYIVRERLPPTTRHIVTSPGYIIPPALGDVGQVYPPSLFQTLVTPYDHRSFPMRIASVLHYPQFRLMTFVEDAMANWYLSGQLRGADPSSLHDVMFGALGTISWRHTMLDWPVPTAPDRFHAGASCDGMIGEAGELDEEIREFVEDPSSKGTIVFAFGHEGDSSFAPAETLAAFTAAMKQLPSYRFVWQFTRGRKDVTIPSNVLALSWVPQPALLVHNKTILFYSHGGMKSLGESLCHGVPMVVMPLFAEQAYNAMFLVRHGLGALVHKKGVKADAIIDAINAVVTDEGYKARAVKMKNMILQQPVPVIHNAAFHVEFLARHKDRLSHVRARSRNLNLLQYWCLDVVLFGVVLLIVPVVTGLWIGLRIVSMCSE